MCGLYGFSYYGDKTVKDLYKLTNALAEQSAQRGTDATGIAFNDKGKLAVCKEGKSAYSILFKHSDNIKALTGHTRHSTQGSEKKNYNNHPFYGQAGKTRFALAHNGVIGNDDMLRRSYKLKKTKIETDSYIAVQLLEYKKCLDMKSIRFMAEALTGSFSFSILDNMNNLYLVKGDSPLSILHFPEYRMYVYASTEEILWRALIDTFLFDVIKSGKYEDVPIREGDILKIQPDGKIDKGKFNYTDYLYTGMYRWDYDWDSLENKSGGKAYADKDREYIDMLKTMAQYYGYEPDIVDELLEGGFSIDEIEEYIYADGIEEI